MPGASRPKAPSPTLKPARRVLAAAAALTLAGAAAQAADSIVLPGDAVFPESVTSTADGTVYVGSIVAGGIKRVPPGAAQAEQWIAPGAFGSRSTFGVLADETSNTLWVCSNDVSRVGIKGPSDTEGNRLIGFDLKTGTGKVSVELPGSPTFCNDIAIGSDGSAYVTNTASTQIFRLPPGSQAFEVWATDPQFQPKAGEGGLDGITFGVDGNLYVNTFTSAELFRIDVKDGKAGGVTRLKPSRQLVLSDEMRTLPDGSVLMIEGGGRLDRVKFSGDDAEVAVLAEIPGGPTGVAVTGDRAWVSVGQLAAAFNPAKAGKPTLPFQLVAVPLQAR